jgi:hypothetical protein
MNLKLPAAVAAALDVDRVVEVHGGLAVDGDDRQVAEILAPPYLLLGDLGRDPTGLAHDLVGERHAQSVLADDRLLIDPRLVRKAEHLDDPADRGAALPGRL